MKQVVRKTVLQTCVGTANFKLNSEKIESVSGGDTYIHLSFISLRWCADDAGAVQNGQKIYMFFVKDNWMVRSSFC